MTADHSGALRQACPLYCADLVANEEDRNFVLSDKADPARLAAGCLNESVDPKARRAVGKNNLKAFGWDGCVRLYYYDHLCSVSFHYAVAAHEVNWLSPLSSNGRSQALLAEVICTQHRLMKLQAAFLYIHCVAKCYNPSIHCVETLCLASPYAGRHCIIEAVQQGLRRLRDTAPPGSHFGSPENDKRTAGRLPEAERRAGALALLEAERRKRARYEGDAASQPAHAGSDAGAASQHGEEVGTGVSHSRSGTEKGSSRESSFNGEPGSVFSTGSGGADTVSTDTQPVGQSVIVIADSDTASHLPAATLAEGLETGIRLAI